MVQSIPANDIVNVQPNVLAAGGAGLALSGLFLDTSIRVPIGTVQSFVSSAAVGAYFGLGSAQALLAASYFLGFDGSTVKPGAMLWTQYNTANVAAYLRGGNISGLSIAQLNAIATGTLTLLVDGASKSGSVNLSSAASFSAAAAVIATALSVACTYDSVSGAFIITSGTTGGASTIAFPTTSAIATSLLLTQATGAVLSQGAAAVASPGAFMDALTLVTQNWASFTTTFNPDGSGNANKLLFAAWTNGRNNRFLYAGWDNDASPTNTNPATTSLGYLVNVTNNYSGTVCIYSPNNNANVATFLLGAIASIDFDQTNGRATLAFRSQTGLAAEVTNQSIANTLIANGYNYYGSYATAAEGFVFFYNGSISGPFDWIDSYINQIWMNNNFQLGLMILLTQAFSIPYNAFGRALIEAALTDYINEAVNFGAIRSGVNLSSLQIAEVNASAGINIAPTLQTRGWYLQVQIATPTVRAARGSPPCNFWYTDGQSIQHINLASIELQ